MLTFLLGQPVHVVKVYMAYVRFMPFVLVKNLTYKKSAPRVRGMGRGQRANCCKVTPLVVIYLTITAIKITEILNMCEIYNK